LSRHPGWHHAAVPTPPRPAPAEPGHDQFARWAPQYEDDVLSQLLTALQHRAAARLRLAGADRFLDVGCATGAAVRAAAATVALAVGVDRSAAMVRRARTLAGALPATDFVVADAGDLPFPAGSFTAVLSTTALRHFDDPARAAREMARVLRPGGRMVVADFLACGDSGPHRWDSRRRRRRTPRWDGPPQAVSQAPVVVTEVARCPTAFGWYATVSAVKPEVKH
jgi:ubiquinone/menaquinone biosynthesis C-methylase UbiE